MMRPLILIALVACAPAKPDGETGTPGDGGAFSDGGDQDGGEDCVPAEEVCDGLDNDCDGEVDEGVMSTMWADVDGDGFGDPATETETCEGHGADNGDDCDDAEATVYPGAPELCDDLDNDCDGETDEDLDRPYWADTDGDGYGDPDVRIYACALPSGYSDNNTDCDDADPLVNPDGEEVANGVDDDCDGSVDEGFTQADCKEILDAGSSIGSGTYTIVPDPTDDEPAFEVLCDMEIDGGGWTQALPDYLAHLSDSDDRQYLYSYDGAWYTSPETTAVWDWASYEAVEGTWSYAASGTEVDDTFDCTSKESGSWGVGCSNGGGATFKVLPAYYSDPDLALSMICQDKPDVFGAGACQDDVAIWERGL